MFHFYASFSDDEIRDIVDNIINKKSEKDFEKLMKYFSPFILKTIHRMINRTKYSGRQTREDIHELNTIANAWLWDYVIKKGFNKWDKPLTFSRFESVFKFWINRNFIGEIHKVFGTPDLKVSRPTFQKMKNVATFMQNYLEKHKRLPDTKTIAKALNITEKSVETYISKGGFYNQKSLNDYVGGGDDDDSRLEEFIEGPSQYLPENRFLEREEKRIISDALARSKETTKSWVTQLARKVRATPGKPMKAADEDRLKLLNNYDEIINKLIQHQGKQQRSIELEYGFNHVKLLNRLWSHFIDNVKNDRKVKQWVEASSRNRMIRKVSRQLVDSYFAKTGEQVIQSVVKASRQGKMEL